MDTRRLFLAALLSMGVLLLWQAVFPPARPPVQETSTPATEEAPVEAVSPRGSVAETTSGDGSEEVTPESERPAPAAPPVALLAGVEGPIEADRERQVTVEGDGFSATVSNRGGQLVSFQLDDVTSNGGVELVRRRQEKPFPFSWVDAEGHPLELNDVFFDVEQQRTREGSQEVVLRYRGPLGEASKTFVFLGEGVFTFEAVANINEEWGVFLGPGLRNPDARFLEDRTAHRGATVALMGELEEHLARKLEERKTVDGRGVEWVAIEDTYFITAFYPGDTLGAVEIEPVAVRLEKGEAVGFLAVDDAEAEDLPVEVQAVLRPVSGQISGRAFWGAKEYDRLAQQPGELTRTIRWGVFGLLAHPLLVGLNWTHNHIVRNYGWSIVLMTVFIKLVLFPLTHKSYISMQRLQKLNPRMEAIRQKYRSKLKDKQGRPNLESQRKMNEEMQALFREEGVNPAGGCLPILLQLPVFLAFYNLLRQGVELWHAPWIFWIQDLSAPDPYYVIPLVMGATQLLQQRLSPPPPNRSQQIIMTTMPIWFTVISLGFPSGLVLYWLTNNTFTIFQQAGYNRLKAMGVLGGEEAKPSSKSRNPA